MSQKLFSSSIGKAISIADIDQWLDQQVDENAPGRMPQLLYRTVAWTHYALNLRANNIAAMPYGVWPAESEDDDKELEVDWDIDLMLPLWETSAWLDLIGAAYWKKLHNAAGDFIGVQVLDSNTMRIEFPTKRGEAPELGDPFVFVQKVGAKEKIYKPDEIVYFRTFSPATDINPGVASGEVGELSGSLILNANQWASRFFKNGAIPAVILETEGQVPDNEVKRIRKAWDRLLSRVNQWSTMILRRGIKANVIGQPIKDLAMPELTQDQKHQILAAHNVPIGYAAEKTNRSEREFLEWELIAQVLVPFMETRIVTVLNEQLFNPMGLRISFQYKQIEAIQREQTKQAEAGAFLFGDVLLPSFAANAITVEEYRRNLDYYLDGANFPGLDEFFVPPMAETDAAQDIIEGTIADAERELPEGVELDTPQIESGKGGLEKKVSGCPMPSSVRAELKRWADKCRKRDKAANFNSDIIPVWFYNQVKGAVGSVGHVEAFSFLKATDAVQRNVERQIQNATQDVFDQYRDDVAEAIVNNEEPNYNEIAAALFAALVPILTNAATERAMRVSAETGVQFDPAELSAQSLEWAQSHASSLIAGLMNTTRRLVQDVTAFASSTPGVTVETIMEQLERAFGENRAEMIGETETTVAFSAATSAIQALLLAAGLSTQRIWQTKRDERVCPICGPLDGTPESVWSRQFPDGPPAHVRCRCTTSLSVLGDDYHIRDAVRRGRERVAMFAEMDDERGAATARQQLKEFREQFT